MLNIVETKKIGNTIIHISDDVCSKKTPEEIQKMLNRIAINTYYALNKKREN